MPRKDPEARRAYHRAYMTRRYASEETFRKKHKARVKINDAIRRELLVKIVTEFRANGCSLCPEKEPCTLSAHHVDPSTKEYSVADLVARRVGPNKLKAELAKCVCLCENCHRKVHAGVLKLCGEAELVQSARGS